MVAGSAYVGKAEKRMEKRGRTTGGVMKRLSLAQLGIIHKAKIVVKKNQYIFRVSIRNLYSYINTAPSVGLRRMWKGC
jgi:hypothetical protein